jgi:hypothetical protein
MVSEKTCRTGDQNSHVVGNIAIVIPKEFLKSLWGGCMYCLESYPLKLQDLRTLAQTVSLPEAEEEPVKHYDLDPGFGINFMELFPGCRYVIKILDASFRQATPLLVQEGWTRHPERCREATFDGADGVVSSAQSLTLTEKHFGVIKAAMTQTSVPD